MRYRFAAKWVSSSIVDIGIVWENGNSAPVARLIMPDDKMIGDTVKCVDDIIILLRKRFKNSI